MDSVDPCSVIIYTGRGKSKGGPVFSTGGLGLKFRTIFILFNLIILFSFSFIFLMPLPILGWSYAWSFWGQNWPIAAAFLVILAALDTYFLLHWRLYSLLEREDWSGLKLLLEKEWEKNGSLNLAKSRIYINACLIVREPDRLAAMRTQYLEKKIAWLPPLALSLALPLILEVKTKADEVVSFLLPFAKNRKTGNDGPWINWALGLAELVSHRSDDARARWSQLLTPKTLPLLELLCLYLLEPLSKDDPKLVTELEIRVPALKSRLTEKEWDDHVAKLKDSVVLVVFLEKQLIQDARQWLRDLPGGTS